MKLKLPITLSYGNQRIFLLIFFCINLAYANSTLPDRELGKKKVSVSASEQDANIYVNGKLLGKGSALVVVPNNSCINIQAEKVGYLSYEIEFCNRKGDAKLPKSYFFKMNRDDAYDASVRTDIANVDIEVTTNLGKDESWKLINRIVLSYLDVLEITDKDTGYLRTAWELQSFTQNTIRTRIIVKQSSERPIAYKIKMVSEQSRRSSISVKSDELFREWDRVLRKYKDLVTEVQSRI